MKKYSRIDDSKAGFVYVINTKENPQTVKIGSSMDPMSRKASLQTGNADQLCLVATYRCSDHEALEKALYSLLNQFRKNGEWFVLKKISTGSIVQPV